MLQNLDAFYPEGGVRGHFITTGDDSRTNDEIVDAIFAIAQQITPQ
jgi:hypothetical protein